MSLYRLPSLNDQSHIDLTTMGFGLSLRNKSNSKKRVSQDDQSAALRASPSLPQLVSTGTTQWPEGLVDASSVHDTPASARNSMSKPSTQKPEEGRFISFHKPFRANSQKSHPESSPPQRAETIASMYSPTTAVSFTRAGSRSVARAPAPRRAARGEHNFNIMVVGGVGTGKTSLLRLLLETCQIASNAAPLQLTSVNQFMSGPVTPTDDLHTATVDIEQGRDRVTLTVIDTPGLDLAPGHELELERSVSAIVKYADTQFANTMSEVCMPALLYDPSTHTIYIGIQSRQAEQGRSTCTSVCSIVFSRLSPPHIILTRTCLRCIYLVGPDSVKPESYFPSENTRHSIALDPPSGRGRQILEDDSFVEVNGGSSPTIDSHRTPTGGARNSEDVTSIEARAIKNGALEHPPSPSTSSQLSLGPSQTRVIKRLSTRMNVLPVISCADTLTNSQLDDIKIAVKRSLDKSGTGFGIFKAPVSDAEDDAEAEDDDDEEDVPEEESRISRVIVKIRSTGRSGGRDRSFNRSERSRSRTRAASTDEDQETSESDPTSAFVFSSTALRALLPFAIMSPDPVPSSATRSSTESRPPPPPSSYHGAAVTPSVMPSDHLANSKGKYTRRYRWGAVDVLDKEHCDFLALRQAVFGPDMRVRTWPFCQSSC